MFLQNQLNSLSADYTQTQTESEAFQTHSLATVDQAVSRPLETVTSVLQSTFQVLLTVNVSVLVSCAFDLLNATCEQAMGLH